MSVGQRFAYNGNNEIAGATLTPSTVQTSDAIFRGTPTRTGGGRVFLLGDYTGESDATFDVEITSGAGSTPRVSEAVFSGAGTGELWAGDEWNASEAILAGEIRYPTDRGDYVFVCTSAGTTGGTEPTWPTTKGATVADNTVTWEAAEVPVSVASGTSSQVFTVELKDLGTDTTQATLDLGIAVLRAQASGAGGNSIRLIVDESGLTLTATNFALLEDWSADKEFQTGDQWDWGARTLAEDGTIPADAPRIAVGSDPQVFRQYKRYEEGKWRYYLSPTPERTLPRGTAVYTVSGGRSVTVTDGVSPEVYTSIETLYDLLADIQASSSLLEIVGAVASDREPGGVDAVDLALRTVPYALPTINSGSDHVRGLSSVTVASSAVTEEVTIRCIDNDNLGSEAWSVSGSLSGALSDAVTAVAYSSTRFAFTIPQRLPDSEGTVGEITLQYTAGADNSNPPPVCFDLAVLGARASGTTVTFRREAVPSAACACDDTAYEGALSERCLGTEIPEDIVPFTNTGLAARIQDLNVWYAGAVGGNTEITSGGELRTAQHDVNLAKQIRDIFTDGLNDIFGADADIHPDAWQAATAYAVNDVVEPVTANGYRYRCTTAGTSDSGEPSWTTTIGDTVNDNTIVWTCISRTADEQWSEYFDDAQTDYTAIDALGDFTDYTGMTALTTSLAVTAGTVYRYNSTVTSAADLDISFLCTKSGTTDSSISTDEVSASAARGSVFKSGTAVFVSLANLLMADEDIDDTTAIPGESGIARSVEQFIKRYESQMDACRALAGLDPKADASLQGGECWQEREDSYWWVDTDGFYLPVWENVVYHSARRHYDADTDSQIIESTQEFAFVLKVACPSQLAEGDEITVRISGVTQNRSYQVGDTMRLPIVRASDRYLEGGVTGDDTLTWSVRGSVDGPLADYAVVDDAETAYSSGGLEFTIYRGGVPFALGDKWTFAVEANQFRWRKDSGAWSGAADIPAESVSLSDGLSASFRSGVAPSFVDEDLFPFTIKQPASPDNIQAPSAHYWAWQGTGGTLTAALGASKTIDMVVLAWHSIPSGATILLEGSTNGSTWPMSETLTWREGVIVAVLDPSWTATHLRITLSTATAGAIGWWWAGEGLQMSVPALEVRQRRGWSLARGAGLNPSALFRGAGWGGSVAWNMLSSTDLDNLLEMLDYVAEQGDQPFLFLPNADTPARANLVRVDGDNLTPQDWSEYQRADGVLVVEATLPMLPVYL